MKRIVISALKIARPNKALSENYQVTGSVIIVIVYDRVLTTSKPKRTCLATAGIVSVS